MLTNRKGFTLIELLVVLSIISFLFIVGASIQTSTLGHQQEKQFYRLFQSDVLYMQQMTMVKRENVYMTIQPNKHMYEIKKGGIGEVILRREFPSNWTVNLNTLSMPLSFTINGTIKNPRMISVNTPNGQYYIYFPFGKGRSYVVEK